MLKSVLKILLTTILVGIILLFVVSIYGYLYLQYSYPNYEGKETVKGVISDVSIYFDDYANSQIVAKNDYDVAYSLGYLHASERLFQIDLMVRTGLGNLSCVYGDSTVTFDIFFRTLGIKDVAIKSYNQLPDYYKKILLAYCNGINEYIDNHKSALPVEFNLLSYKPLKWKPYYPIIVSKMVAWEMNLSWWSDIVLTNIYHRLGDNAKLFILDENEQIGKFSSKTDTIAMSNTIVELDKKVRKFLGFDGIYLGSNNWVVAPKLSKNGKPIIANDPHLVIRNPNFFYFVSIKSPEWNSSGFTIPGIPAVIIGKNNDIAWAITNLMLDDCDFYVEKVNYNEKTYMLDGQNRKLYYINDTIHIGNKHIIFTKYYTHRGPILSNIEKYNNLITKVQKSKVGEYSIRWTGLEPSGEIKSMIDINKAKNFEEFRNAFRVYVAPGQNYIYADKNGNIGYLLVGKIPIRSTNGTTIAFDGTTIKNDWQSYVPYEQMPYLYNPENGFIATANNKVIKNFNYHITNFWEPSSRIERINQLLTSKIKFDIKDFKSFQNDIYSPYANVLKGFVIKAFKNFNIKDNNLKLSLTILSGWQGNMDKNLQAPLIYQMFLKKYIQNTIQDELGDKLFQEYLFLANMPLRLIYKLTIEGNSILFDNVNTMNVKENRDYIIRKSFADAILELEKDYGYDISLWQWGIVHKISPQHLFEQNSKVFKYLLNTPEYSVNGDGTTVFNTEYLFTSDFSAKVGPSIRFIYDFNDPNIINICSLGGQSGHLLSEDNMNQLKNFIDGKYNVFNEKASFKRGVKLVK
jgi:penicillin amidase